MQPKFLLGIMAVLGLLAITAMLKMAATMAAGLLTAGAIIFLLLKLPLKKLLAFDVGLDVLITFALVFMFAGTYSGMVAAALAGCIVSGFLLLAKRVMGYEKPKVTRRGLRWEKA